MRYSTFGLSFFLLVSTSIDAATLLVPQDFATIQAAINAANIGDTVYVAPGTYLERIQFNKNLELRSMSGASSTVIDGSTSGNGAVVVFTNVDRSAVLDGFTVQGGVGTGPGGIAINGSPTIINNIIQNNRGGGGNGIGINFSNPLIRHNIIRNNTDSGLVSGGGGGGGIKVGGNACSASLCTEIIGNLIEGNSTPGFLSGGGIYLFASGPVRIIGNTIRNNSAPREGGGIAAVNSSDALIENNLFQGNFTSSAGGRGGAVYWLVPSGERGVWLIGNTMINNSAIQGAAVYADGYDRNARIANNLMVNSTATSGVVSCGSFNDPFSPVIRNNMIDSGGSSEFAGLCSNALGSDDNFAGVPTFEPSSFMLSATSLGVDRGFNDYVSTASDIDGKRRIDDGDGNGVATVDVGAFEFQILVFADGFE